MYKHKGVPKLEPLLHPQSYIWDIASGKHNK